MKRKTKRIWAILLTVSVMGAGVYFAVLQPTINELNAGMCRTYFPDEPDCIQRLNEAR